MDQLGYINMEVNMNRLKIYWFNLWADILEAIYGKGMDS
jgi:hypothetical protein